MRKRTQEEFENLVKEKLGNDYQVISKYINANSTVKIQHIICGTIYDVFPSNIQSGCGDCAKCRKPARKYTQESFIEKVKSIDPDIEVIDEYTVSYAKMKFYYKPEDIYFYTTPQEIYKKIGYPFSKKANGAKPKKGISDLWTTHPEIAQFLVNEDDGYNYSYGTRYELDFKCPICGTLIHKRPNQILSKKGILKCNCCSQGISYPERFLANVFRQNNIEYVSQYNKFKGAIWAKNFRYDFYLPQNNSIVEVNGFQHYVQKDGWTNLEEIQRIDNLKKKLALDNGITNYITINASKSRRSFLQEQILLSELNNLFDLSNTDWIECDKSSCKPILMELCEDWNNNFSLEEIKEKYKLHEETIYRYFRIGESSGLLNKEFRKNKIKTA